MFQRFININVPLTQCVKHRVVGGIENEPTLMYAEEPFPHPGAFGSSGTVERKQGFGSRFDSGSLQPRGEQDLGGFFACKGKGLTKFTSMPVCALKVRFVDQYNVGQFEQTGLFGLNWPTL